VKRDNRIKVVEQ